MRYISTTEAAKMLRAELKATFPGIKFSVRQHHGSLNVSYTDGPAKAEVEKVTNGYSGEGFDGMIDMRYSYKAWLLPSGRIVDAGTSGTEGSRGSVPAYEIPCPCEGAELVSLLTDFVFVERRYSEGLYEAEKAKIAREYGVDTDPAKMEHYNRSFGYCWLESQARRNLTERGL